MIKSILLASLLAVKLATPGDLIDEIEMEDIQFDITDQTLYERFSSFLSSIFTVDDDPEEIDIADDQDYKSMPMLLAVQKKAENTYKNVVVYEGSFNNTECRLFVPYAAFSSLSVIDGVLTNVGNSSLTGRILYNGDEIDVNDYDTFSYILNPVYNSPSNVYRYGSYNYQRHYYVQSNNIAYSDTYGKFYVDNVHIYYNDTSRTYYSVLAVILMLGVIAIRGRK